MPSRTPNPQVNPAGSGRAVASKVSQAIERRTEGASPRVSFPATAVYRSAVSPLRWGAGFLGLRAGVFNKSEAIRHSMNRPFFA